MLLTSFFYRNGVLSPVKKKDGQERPEWPSVDLPGWDSPRTVFFVFGAPEFLKNPQKIRELSERFPQSHFVGCSTAGEIFQNQVLDGSLSVAVVRFEHTDVKLASSPIGCIDDSYQVGKSLADKLTGPKLSGILIFSEGIKVNGSALVQGINAGIPEGVTVAGGLAGDGPHFRETWVIHDKIPTPGHVTAIGFYGERFQMNHSSQGGWDIFGPERIVTKSQGNILYEIDGKPALQLYKEYLGDKASELPASALLFPLQIRSHREEGRRLVRTVLSVNEEEQYMVFAGDIPQGSLAQLMKANFDRLIDGASRAANLIYKKSPPLLVLAISCVGRRLVLGERIEEEVEATLEKFPSGTHQVGFYSYGELSPYVKGGPCELHNQTMTLTTISED